MEGCKKKAVECYEKALEHTEGDIHKGKIAITLHDIFEADKILAQDYRPLMDKLKAFLE